jgi:hypothetical protein
MRPDARRQAVEDIRLGNFRLNDSGFAVPYPPPRTRWTDRVLEIVLPHWPLIAIGLATLAMLLTFSHVLREAVRTSELRHQASAAHQRETWRCNALLGSRARISCLAQLNAPHDEGAAEPPHSLAVLTGAAPKP